MARKRTAVPVVTKWDVAAALRRNEILKATELAKQLADSAPTPENLELFVNTLRSAFAYYLEYDKVRATVETLKFAADFAAKHPSINEEVAVFHANAGDFAKALQLANTPRVNYHIADLCVRRGKAEGVSETLTNDLATILKAFREYEAGNDEAARVVMSTLGLTSAFMQWRLLLRGLIAYTTGDHARALENWQRLNPDLTPSILAMPLRAKIDEAYRERCSATVQAELHQRAELLETNETAKQLRAIQKYTSRGEQSLREIWKHVQALVAPLKAPHPHLFARLAQILYHAILRQGEPSDLKQYKLIFGTPADDPNFYKLEALVFESLQNQAAAVALWKKYDEWLATKPAGWPNDVLGLARARIHYRIGEMLEEIANEIDLEGFDEDDLVGRSPADIVSSLFAKRQKKPKSGDDPRQYFAKAIELAPDWTTGVKSLMEFDCARQAYDAAAKLGEQFLQRNPNNIFILNTLARVFLEQKRPLEHLATLKRALAVNPLDDDLNQATAVGYASAARFYLLGGQLAKCEELTQDSQPITAKRAVATMGAIRVVLLRKQGKLEEASELETKIVSTGAGKLSAMYYIAVLGQLVKLKPTLRKAADDRLKAALASATPVPAEVVYLYSAWIKLVSDGTEYRGQPTHEKKMVTLVERSFKADADNESFERLLGLLADRVQAQPLKRSASLLSRRFPENPVFYVAQVQAMLMTPATAIRERYRISRLLDQAESAARSSAHPRHQEILEIISELKQQFSEPTSDLPFPMFR
jgi:tetratricopeptide (TPR) repeat protein